MASDLTARELEILAFERHWWRYGVGKDAAIREHLGMGSLDYHQTVNALLDRPEAMEHDPLLVKRLRRLRMTRQRRRSTGRLGARRITRSSG